ncbi:hypothetical protein SAMN05216553_104278 [Lentzea fradiae]|uniref:Uncharacterized protein n=1 Tax=Lentzea fradiae TaxID=200378 RepID=A0A1G7Q5Z6_9PSEU|nr:hypothetical protein [Lentzea fradiae]SDF93888.1 hypothetical protein SAMN05216553_104278 [Lentzea fradiae]
MDETLRDAVLHRLALLDEAAEQGEAEALVPLARAEIHRLADGWRLLLTVHQPDEDSRCKVCPGWLRRRRWPCQVWNMAHQHLIGEGMTHRERRRPLRNPFTRSGIVDLPVEPPREAVSEMTTELPVLRGAPPGVHRAPVVSRPKHALPD